jgi:hypothetical protein
LTLGSRAGAEEELGGRRRKKESVKLLHPRVNYMVFLSNMSPLSKILLLESMRSVDVCVIAIVLY